MTLKQYIDWIRYEAKDLGLPESYLTRKINASRRKIAKRTLCLEAISTCESEAGTSDYRIPHSENDDAYVECIEVMEVWYDGNIISEKLQEEMRWLMQTTTQGTPVWWCYFGGNQQPTGFLELRPIPSTSFKEIKIHHIHFPLPLINLTDICELNDVIQDIVLRDVLSDIMMSKWHPQTGLLIKQVEKEIRENRKMRARNLRRPDEQTNWR